MGSEYRALFFFFKKRTPNEKHHTRIGELHHLTKYPTLEDDAIGGKRQIFSQHNQQKSDKQN